jgi:hypothetical protein
MHTYPGCAINQREDGLRSAIVALSVLLFTFSATKAQSPSTSSGGFEKKNYNYSEWTKGLFSEVVTVTHAGKMIFLASVGAEDESDQRGAIRNAILPANVAMPSFIVAP